jgi:15-cis-phytoene synthase/lycopene beta-cyclase
VADDLIDNAPSSSDASQALGALDRFLDHAYLEPDSVSPGLDIFVKKTFPHWTHAALLLLPTAHLPKGPLVELLEGFRTDLQFHTTSLTRQAKPNGGPGTPVADLIVTESDLLLYGRRVAGTVGELCLSLVFAHAPRRQGPSTDDQAKMAAAASDMGIALQCVNIARDVWVDARMEPAGRVYLPSEWLAETTMGPEDVLSAAKAGADANTRVLEAVGVVRARVLDRGMELYLRSRGDIERLPRAWGARRGVRVAVEAYMAIGRKLAKRPKGAAPERWEVGSARRATVPSWKRFWVLWSAMARG